MLLSHVDRQHNAPQEGQYSGRDGRVEFTTPHVERKNGKIWIAAVRLSLGVMGMAVIASAYQKDRGDRWDRPAGLAFVRRGCRAPARVHTAGR